MDIEIPDLALKKKYNEAFQMAKEAIEVSKSVAFGSRRGNEEKIKPCGNKNSGVKKVVFVLLSD